MNVDYTLYIIEIIKQTFLLVGRNVKVNSENETPVIVIRN